MESIQCGVGLLEVSVYDDFEILDEALPDWDLLKRDFREVTAFQSMEWLRYWWNYETLINKKVKPYIVIIKKERETIGILPLYTLEKTFAGVRFRILKPIGMIAANTLTPILSKKESPHKILKKAMEKIYEDKDNWDCIHWGDLPKGSDIDMYFKNRLVKENKLVYIEGHSVSPRILFTKDIKTTMDNVNKRFLKEILSKKSKLEQSGNLSFHKVGVESEIEPIMDGLFELIHKRWQNIGMQIPFECATEREHYKQLAKDLFKRNLLYLVYLSYDDEIIATSFGMVDDKTNWLYIHGINMGYRKFSVGHLLAYHIILDSYENNFETVDFLLGDENDYKQKWGPVNQDNIKYSLYNHSLKSLLFRFINNTYYSKEFGKRSIMNQFLTKSVIRGCTFILGTKEKIHQRLHGNVY